MYLYHAGKEYNSVPFETLKGLTLVSIEQKEIFGNDALIFQTQCGRVFCMTHDQDCCENVELSEVHGTFDDMLGSEIFHAVEAVSEREDDSDFESVTWTFYHLATRKGWVTLRWCGSSNGYYSEAVNLYEVDKLFFEGETISETEKAIQEFEDEAFHHSSHPAISDKSLALALVALNEKLARERQEPKEEQG